MTEHGYELLVWMSWFVAGLLFVPPLIFAAKLEWEDWSRTHAKGFHFWKWHSPHPAH
jgi:hypothetical protein